MGQLYKIKINVDNPKKSPTILSLCTGYGGLEKGIESVIGKCTGLAYVEIEAFAVANLVNKMETGKLDAVPIWTDLKTFDAKSFRGCVDILTGGYPCQPFSAAGKRNGTDDPRHLWPYIRTIVMDCKPQQCFLENVEGHLTLGISEVLSDLEAMGYRSQVGIFSASEVGAPHQRKRVFILADSRSGSSETGTKRTGRKKGSDFDRRSEKSELGNSQSDNERRLSVSTMYRERVEIRGSSFQRWPSRPGEPQHEWEEPRVVADTTDTDRRTGKPAVEKEPEEWRDRSPDEGGELANSENLQRGSIERGAKVGILRENSREGKTKPELGRAINGARNRVDRLRLLGNGVVPQTAAKAYLTLWRKLNAN